MFNRVRCFLGAAVLAAGLALGSPAVAAPPPETPEQTQIGETKIITFEDDGPSYLERIVQEEEKLSLNVDFRLFTLNTAWLKAQPDSLLSYVNNEEIGVPTLGVSIDYVVAETDKVNNWQVVLPFNFFVEFSSTKFFMSPLEHEGLLNHMSFWTKYKIKGDMTYFGVGMGFVPTINYHAGPVRLGLFFEARGGLTHLTSNYEFMAGPWDQYLREILEREGINPDVTGTIKIRGMGGFAQFMVGPSIGLYNFTCRGGVGVRINSFPSLKVHERIEDSVFLGDAQENKYNAEYSDIVPIYGVTCGMNI